MNIKGNTMNENRNLLIYKIAITLIPGVGPVTAKKLINECGSVEAVFNEQSSRLIKIEGIKDKLVADIRDKNLFRKAEKEIAFITEKNIRTMFFLMITIHSVLNNALMLHYYCIHLDQRI